MERILPFFIGKSRIFLSIEFSGPESIRAILLPLKQFHARMKQRSPLLVCDRAVGYALNFFGYLRAPAICFVDGHDQCIFPYRSFRNIHGGSVDIAFRDRCKGVGLQPAILRALFVLNNLRGMNRRPKKSGKRMEETLTSRQG